ncbi:MAG: DNA adenine methylase, partial [Chitinophagaceae bacterium]
MKIQLKTPISYYGGKQKLCSLILDLIPAHNLYCEPFVGGGAVFFGKQPSNVEVLNDTNKELINFYQVTQNH